MQLTVQHSAALSDFERVTSGSLNDESNGKYTAANNVDGGEFLAARGRQFTQAAAANLHHNSKPKLPPLLQKQSHSTGALQNEEIARTRHELRDTLQLIQTL